MPLSVEKMANAERRVVFKFLGEDVCIEYRLGALAADAMRNVDEETTLHDLLERILIRWDIQADGQEIPTTAAAMREHKLPTPFLRAVQEAIFDDSDPKKLKR